FVPERIERSGWRSDEGRSDRVHGFRKGLFFAEQAVAGMHRVRSGIAHYADDRVDIEIAVTHGRRTDAYRLAGERNVRRVDVRVGENSDGLESQPFARSKHTASDLAAIGNQDLFEHELNSVSGEPSYPRAPVAHTPRSRRRHAGCARTR